MLKGTRGDEESSGIPPRLRNLCGRRDPPTTHVHRVECPNDVAGRAHRKERLRAAVRKCSNWFPSLWPLVEGPTLADRIKEGPLALEEAVAIGKQIVEALEFAHDRSVIHRDLKPANIKITPEGVVKVLDFGLAKVLEDEPPKSSLADSPTLTLGHTRAGMILGTAAYMSPEQAVGRPADRRSDIFCFGAVLYEMLAGKSAFVGSTTPDVLEAVVKNEPDWSGLAADTPNAIQRLLRRCLAKDRRQRLQAIGEARIVLENPGGTDRSTQATGLPQKKLPWVVAGIFPGWDADRMEFRRVQWPSARHTNPAMLTSHMRSRASSGIGNGRIARLVS